MKKVFLFALAAFTLTVAKSQDDSDKNFRFGLKIVPGIQWMKVDDARRFESGGSVMGFGYGLMTEFKLAGAAWLSTGVQVDYDRGKVSFTDTAMYLHNNSDGMLPVEDMDISNPSSTNGYDVYWLRERKYKSTCLTIPLNLRLKTKEIGYLTYYGQFGLNTSIHLKTKADDMVNKFNSGSGNGFNPTQEENNDLNINKEMGFVKFGLNIGAGAEYNLSGSTSILFGVNFLQGFSNSVKGTSEYNIDVAKSSTSYVAQKQKFVGSAIGLTVAVLF